MKMQLLSVKKNVAVMNCVSYREGRQTHIPFFPRPDGHIARLDSHSRLMKGAPRAHDAISDHLPMLVLTPTRAQSLAGHIHFETVG